MDRLFTVGSVRSGMVASVTLAGLLLWGYAASGQDENGDGRRERGVVVEEVDAGSALGKAGIRAGDVLLAWELVDSERAENVGAKGEIASPFEWEWLTLEQAPRGTVRLTGQRNQEAMVFEVTPGEWDAGVRPEMPSPLLDTFLQGKERSEAGDPEAASALWEKLAGNVEADWRLRCWILLQTGEAWAAARELEKAQGAYRSALELAQDPLSQVAVRQIMGDAYRKQDELDRAREVYAELQVIRENNWAKSLALAKSWNELGGVAYRQGQLIPAQNHWKRALKIRQELAPDSLEVAVSLNNLGVVVQHRGDLERAIEYYQQALETPRTGGPGKSKAFAEA